MTTEMRPEVAREFQKHLEESARLAKVAAESMRASLIAWNRDPNVRRIKELLEQRKKQDFVVVV